MSWQKGGPLEEQRPARVLHPGALRDGEGLRQGAGQPGQDVPQAADWCCTSGRGGYCVL